MHTTENGLRENNYYFPFRGYARRTTGIVDGYFFATRYNRYRRPCLPQQRVLAVLLRIVNFYVEKY